MMYFREKTVIFLGWKKGFEISLPQHSLSTQIFLYNASNEQLSIHLLEISKGSSCCLPHWVWIIEQAIVREVFFMLNPNPLSWCHFIWLALVLDWETHLISICNANISITHPIFFQISHPTTTYLIHSLSFLNFWKLLLSSIQVFSWVQDPGVLQLGFRVPGYEPPVS